MTLIYSIYLKRLRDYKNAVDRLEEELQETESEIVIDGILHRFEFTFKLAWKTVKDALEYLGLVDKTGSPRENIQVGFRHGIIEDGEKWIEIMLSRNALAHLYDEKSSREIYQKIKKDYIQEFKKLREKLEGI
jgi:nucleotidyltransferase substrate binding protein (TIGR01987 family)